MHIAVTFDKADLTKLCPGGVLPTYTPGLVQSVSVQLEQAHDESHEFDIFKIGLEFEGGTIRPLTLINGSFAATAAGLALARHYGVELGYLDTESGDVLPDDVYLSTWSGNVKPV